MGTFLSYSIISGLLLLALFLVFRLTLATEHQHGYNRGIVLSIYAIAFLSLPAIDLVKQMFLKSEALTLPGAVLDFTTIVSSAGLTHNNAPIWGEVLIWIFLIGMVVMSAMTAIAWFRIFKVIRAGEKIKKDGYTLVLIDNEGIAPFSWIRYVVMSRKDYEQCAPQIISHELGHIRLYHWADLMVAQTVIIINWFNPAAWLMREELMLIHEYQADMAVISNGCDAKDYQMLLIKKAVGARFPSLANSLNHSKLKKRITMMYQKKSGKGRRLKALVLVPAYALALAAISIPQVQAAMSTISNSAASLGKVTEYFTQSQEGHSDGASSEVQQPQANPGTWEDVQIVGVSTKEKPNSWEDVQVIGVGAKEKSEVTSDSTSASTAKNHRYIVDGVEVTSEEANQIDPSNIEEVYVFNGEDPRIVINPKKPENEATSTPSEFIVDDKQMSAEQFYSTYTPDDIETITVDSQKNKVYVTLKK